MSELEKGERFLGLVYGTAEEGRSWIGRKVGPRACEDEVTRGAIKHFCALVEDRNPIYWDESLAKTRFAGVPAPPGMLLVWSMPPVWRPDAAPEPPILSTRVPLPGNTVINVSTDSDFLAPIVTGDRLTVEDVVTDVSPEKSTALGRGHFITTDMTYRNQRGETVARHTNVLYRYSIEGAAAPREASNAPAARDGEPGGELLPEVVLPVTVKLCVHDASATRDYFPGHHDRDYARAQGARDAYLNTMFFHGFVDRVVTDWAGPDATIRKRRLRMMAPICIGDTIRTRASVVERAGKNVQVRVEVRTEHGLGTEAVLTCEL